MQGTRHHVIRFLLAALAFVQSWVISDVIYQRVPTGADENSYLFQAQIFSEGRLKREAPPLEECFKQEMVILDEQAGWLSRYPPGHPLWLTPGAWLDQPYAMIALAAALGVWLVCGAAAQAGLPPALAGGLLIVSPFFALMYGTLLSHTSGLVAVAAMLYGYLGWLRSKRWPWAALAGLAWAFFFLNRTYTATLIALPFGLHALWEAYRDRQRNTLLGVAAFAACAGAGVVFYLIYNRLAVGDFFTATYLFYEPSEGLGFGPRRVQGMKVLHTLSRGWSFVQSDVPLLDRWLLGFPGSLVAVLVLGLAGWRRWTAPFLTAAAAVWIGYLYFWFHGVTDAGGPAYYFETLPLLVLLGTAGLHRLWSLRTWPVTIRRAMPVILFAGLAAQSYAFLRRETPPIQERQELKRRVADELRDVPAHAMVLIDHLDKPHLGEMAINLRGLASDPLLLRSLQDDWAVCLRVFPERRAFEYDSRLPTRMSPLHAPDRITLERPASRMIRQTGRNEEQGPATFRVADEQHGDQPGWLAMGKHIYLPRGTFTVAFHGDAEGLNPTAPMRFDVATREGRVIVREAEITGSPAGTLCTIEVNITNVASKIEPRAYYGGSGRVRLDRVTLIEQPTP